LIFACLPQRRKNPVFSFFVINLGPGNRPFLSANTNGPVLPETCDRLQACAHCQRRSGKTADFRLHFLQPYEYFCKNGDVAMAGKWMGYALAAAMTLAAGAQAAEPVKVGSKIDTEGSLLGNIILLVLESHGVKTVNKIQLGTTPVVRGAIAAGELDIYPEYTGNGAFFFKQEKSPVWKNAQQGYDKVKALDAQKNHLIWLTAAPANNTWTIAVRQDLAQKGGLATLADLSRYLKQGGQFRLAASAEFIERPDALPAFEKAYDFKLEQAQLLSLAGGDTAVTLRAAAQRTSGVNAAMAYGTDGPVAALGLVTLSDPKAVQPIYAPAPVVREAVLKAYPQMGDWLKPVFSALDEKTLQKLNASIAVDGLDARKVAGNWLKQKGLLQAGQ
jgi:osmoprotectant transport system substrate-binding protein